MSTKNFKPPVLRLDEEEEIVDDVIAKAKKGEDGLRQYVINKVVQIIKSENRKNRFRNGAPGDKWFSLVRRRHNHMFVGLNKSILAAVESIGFTEKVMNTTTYPRSPIHVSPEDVKPRGKRERRPKVLYTPEKSPASTPTKEMMTPSSSAMVSPEESGNLSDEGEVAKCQDSQTDSTDFKPGSRLEVMDFNEKWYPVKVVEVDYDEGEVLVHFEKWSDRYDEWMRMDSNRIRRPQLPPKIQLLPVTKNKSKLSQINIPSSKKTFVKNEKIMAVWAYNHKYPATVREVLPNDKYEVLFCDGYAKILRGCKLFKASEEDLRKVQIPPPKKPAPPMGADPYDPDLGPKEERRLKKRRLDVLESYLPQKRQKLDTSPSTPETSPQPSTSYKPKEMPKVRLRLKERPKERERERDESPEDEEDRYPTEDESQDQDDDFSEHETPVRRRRRKHTKDGKKVFDESKYVYKGMKHRTDDTNERWEAEIPQGTSPVQIKDKEGYCRESVIIPDKKIPQGWTKHTMRRKHGAKWDVFLVNSEGRKFRSRNELRNYFAEQKMPFPEECFDFQVGRKMEMIQTQQKLRETLSEAAKKSSQKESVQRKSERECSADTKKQSDDTPDKKIKTLLPKSRTQDAAEGEQSTPSSSVISPSFPLSELRTSDGGYTCCGKNFRKENLFQMHMKHYHPEYSNLFGASPNVADLAYARTSGGPLEDSRAEAMTPRSSLVERVNKYEAERKAHVDTPSSASVSEKVQEKDTSPETEPAAEPIQPTVEKPKDEPLPSEETKQEEVATKDNSTIKEEPVPASEEQTDMEPNDSFDAPSPSEVSADESETETPEEKPEETPPVTKEPEPVVPEKPPSPPPVVTPRAIPIIRPVSKTQTPKPVVKPEPPAVQTPTSKPPVIITKYIPPGQKPPSSNLTKLTINTTLAEKENKPTIKTLLPMRPPSSETKEGAETTKSKDTKVKEEVEEEPIKSRPRKRTVSEPVIKKPKISKPTTGSLEEEPPMEPPLEPPSSPTATNTSYRFSRNRTQVPRVSLEKLKVTADNYGRVVLRSGEGNDSMLPGPEPGEKVHVEPLPAADVSSENLRKEEIINCTCGYMEEDGLMIQCDLCLCWQHGLCNKIDKESDVPEKYVCSICQNPTRQRASTKYRHNQDWLKEGKLPSLPFRVKDEESVAQGELMLKKSHDLIASLLQLKTVIRSLRIKTNIVKRPDHPKLYLWAKSWKNDNVEGKPGCEDEHKTEEDLGPKPEAAIDETECRLRLLEHVEDYQHQVEDRLTFIQAQIAALESEDPDLASDEAEDHCPVTKQTVQMLLTDLGTMRKVAALN